MTETKQDYTPAVIDVTAAVMPINVEAAVARWKAYQKLCVEILTDDDYATISGKKARKRSGWRKLGRFMGVSIEIIGEERWERADTFGYTFTVRASTRDGQYQDGDGLCDSTEFTGRIQCSEHNVRSKALTRAKNRATADLIGGGEVSAEELDNSGDKPQRRKDNGDPPRPWKPDMLKKKMLIAVGKKANATGEPSQGQIGLLAGKLEEAWPGDKGAADNRHEVLGWLTGQRSAKDLTLGWVATLLNWLLANDGETFNEHSREEARLVYKQAMLDQGQQELDIPIDEAAKKKANGKHWTKGQDWKQFWVYWKRDKGLTEADIHKAAGVDSMTDYTGTRKELQAAVDAYIKAQIEAGNEAAAQEAGNQEPANNEAAKSPEQHMEEMFGNAEGRQ